MEAFVKYLQILWKISVQYYFEIDTLISLWVLINEKVKIIFCQDKFLMFCVFESMLLNNKNLILNHICLWPLFFFPPLFCLYPHFLLYKNEYLKKKKMIINPNLDLFSASYLCMLKVFHIVWMALLGYLINILVSKGWTTVHKLGTF